MDKYEKAVYNYFNEKSKSSVCFRFQDALDASKASGVIGKGRLAFMKKNPSDLLVCDNGDMFFAEVKHTSGIKGVTNSLFEEQRVARDRVLQSSGKYFYFIYSTNINMWYKVPGAFIRDNPNAKWKELGQFLIDYIPAVYL